jgi:phage regulator Rha-like protein
MAKPQAAIIPVERIASRIYLIRGEKIMLDSDLAELYGVATSALNQQVKRNVGRFPSDFSFQLTEEEHEFLISQFVISNAGRGGRRKLPWVFTEHGVAMLSSVLRSERAVQVNVAIIRTFIKLREILSTHKDLARKVEQHDRQIVALFDSLQKLLAPPNPPKKHPIGYVPTGGMIDRRR